jgi:hypothetical protein
LRGRGPYEETVHSYLPDDVIHADDVLFLCILGVADNSGTCLHPCISTVLIHEAVILRHYLAFIDHWKARLKLHRVQATNVQKITGTASLMLLANFVVAYISADNCTRQIAFFWKQGGKVWTGFIWLRIGTTGGLL